MVALVEGPAVATAHLSPPPAVVALLLLLLLLSRPFSSAMRAKCSPGGSGHRILGASTESIRLRTD